MSQPNNIGFHALFRAADIILAMNREQRAFWLSTRAASTPTVIDPATGKMNTEVFRAEELKEADAFLRRCGFY